MRATRELLRRRMPLARTRGARLAHVQHTNSQDHLPAIGKKIASTANRDGVAERCADPAVHKSLEVELALIGYEDDLLRDVERPIVTTAKHHDAQTLSLRHTVPGIGKMLRLVLRYEMHDIACFPRGQDCASSGRVVTCARASAGQHSGTSGAKIGHAHLTWAFSEAAVLCLRENPPAQTLLARLEKKPSQGHAVTILAHTWARTVSDMGQRQTACDLDTVFQG